MVRGDCGCKDYFEDDRERSDTESLYPYRRPIMVQPNVMPYMSLPSWTPAPPPQAFLPNNPDPVAGITAGSLVQAITPTPQQPFPTAPPGMGLNPIQFPQPVVYPQQQAMPPGQQIMMPAGPQLAPQQNAMMQMPQPGPIQQPNYGVPQIPLPPQQMQGPTGMPVPMMPMSGGIPAPPQPQPIHCPPGFGGQFNAYGQIQI
jgi:hypothetical protein